MHHYLAERLSALALVPLTVWFLWSAVHHFGAGYADARSFLAQPMNATLAVAFVTMLYYHAALGLQVVIEDYVYGAGRIVLLLLNRFACAAVAVACIIAILKLAV